MTQESVTYFNKIHLPRGFKYAVVANISSRTPAQDIVIQAQLMVEGIMSFDQWHLPVICIQWVYSSNADHYRILLSQLWLLCYRILASLEYFGLSPSHLSL